VKSIVEFCRFVRANGMSAGTKETLDCLEAACVVANADRDAFKFALRAVLCASEEDWVRFDDLFAAFWSEAELVRAPRSKSPSGNRADSPVPGHEYGPQSVTGFGDGSALKAEGEQKAFSGASAIERLRKIDFGQMSQTDLAELERIAARLLHRLSYRVSRRFRSGKRHGSINLRRTIRRSICRGGELLDLCYKEPKKERTKLVVLLDVSDSMNPYSLFLLKFAYMLGKCSRQVESFIFSTNLVAVSKLLRSRRMSEALRMLADLTSGWSGGTRIGYSLCDFNKLYAPGLLSPDTVFIIMSDGWDTGTPEAMVAELRKIKRRVNKLIWLNPLLGLVDYEPVTRAMSAALPLLDVFAPGHNLQSLLELEKHLLPGQRC
jgi:uncharacterized protein